jgi:hypothetical protein
MEIAESLQIYDELAKVLPDLLSGSVTERLQTELRQLREVMPEPDIWTVEATDKQAVALMLSGNTLLSLTLTADPPEASALALTGRSLDQPNGTVSVESGRPAQRKAAGPFAPIRGWERTWTFNFGDGSSQAVVGFVALQNGEKDPSEQFARQLAGRFGWSVPIPPNGEPS